MSFFKRLINLFTGSGGGADGGRMLPIYVLNHRCKEPVAGIVDRHNELSIIEDGDYRYYVRKVLHTSGRDRCFGEVEVQLWFDGNRQLKEHEVQGGRWLNAEEYEQELARFNAPPEADDEDATTDETVSPENVGEVRNEEPK